MGERLFTPKSLERVAEAVEWEEDLVWYNDGTTNQERYMQAMGVLWERWMRGWSLPDFYAAVQVAGGGNFMDGLVRVLRTLPQRIYQLKGFYEGLWRGANPGGIRAILPPAPATTRPPVSLQTVLVVLETFLSELQTIVSSIEGVRNV